MCKIECKNCEKTFSLSIHSKDFDFEEIERTPREMGPEFYHQGRYYFECPNCGQTGTLIIDCWEYPEGAYNYCEAHIEDGKFEIIECDCSQICGDFISSKFAEPEEDQ